MRIWHRLVVLLSSIIILALAVISLGMFVRGPQIVTEFLIERVEPYHLFLAALFFLLFFVLLAAVAFHMRKIQKTLVYKTAFGEVQIADTAVEDLAYREVKRVKGIKDAGVHVKTNKNGGLEIDVAATILPDINIPQVSQEVRTRIADYVRETTGIPVDSVSARVVNISHEARPRVQ